jgi:hypothetical protein
VASEITGSDSSDAGGVSCSLVITFEVLRRKERRIIIVARKKIIPRVRPSESPSVNLRVEV